MTNKDLAGGGGLLDISVHALDRALYMMNYPQPVTVSGALFSEFGTRGQGLGGWGSDIFKPDANIRFDVDDLAWAFVCFDNGVVLQFQVSWAVHNADAFSCAISVVTAALKLSPPHKHSPASRALTVLCAPPKAVAKSRHNSGRS